MFPPCSRRGVMVITTVQLHSTKPKLRFCAGSNLVRHVGDSQWWGSLRMVPAGNKVKCLLSVNHTTKTIHHHHHSSTLKSLKSTKFIFQNNIIATFIYLEVIRVNYIVGTPLPYLPKTESLGGVQNVLLERGINVKRGLPLFYYFIVQSHLLCVWGK